MGPGDAVNDAGRTSSRSSSAGNSYPQPARRGTRPKLRDSPQARIAARKDSSSSSRAGNGRGGGGRGGSTGAAAATRRNRVRFAETLVQVKLIPYRRLKVWYLEDIEPPASKKKERRSAGRIDSSGDAAVDGGLEPTEEDELRAVGAVPILCDNSDDGDDNAQSAASEIEHVIAGVDPAKREHLIEGMMVEILHELRDDEGEASAGATTVDDGFDEKLTNDKMEDFIRTRALQWIDEVNESDDDASESDGNPADGSELVLKHSFLSDQHVPCSKGKVEGTGQKLISSSSTSKKAKKKSSFKRHFKKSLKGEVVETKKRAERLSRKSKKMEQAPKSGGKSVGNSMGAKPAENASQPKKKSGRRFKMASLKAELEVNQYAHM